MSVDKQKIVNIKSLKIIDVNNNRYAIIGKDPDSHDLFIVNLDKNTSQDYMIYQKINFSYELDTKLCTLKYTFYFEAKHIHEGRHLLRLYES